METSVDNLRLILGLKLKNLRHERGASLKEVAQRAGVSISYLSEIEKGKKYPKTGKLIDLARALGVPFDDLVSQRVDASLGPLKQAIASPFVQEFPFQLFGVKTQDLVSLMASMPDKAGALIRTFADISRNYDVRVEHVLFAALRSYQQLHGNHFPDLEARAAEVRAAKGWDDGPLLADTLRAELERTYGYAIDADTLARHPDLSGFRSVFVAEGGRGGGPKLLINGNLLPSQRAFVYAREIGFEVLGVDDRPETSSWLEVTSFEQVLGNFRASYFAGALLISRAALDRDLGAFFKQARWDEAAFLAAFDRYHATPEMFFYRLSQLIPADFGLREFYFMRFNNPRGTDRYGLTKVLNLSGVPVPHGFRRDEHYCRRWPSMGALRALDAQQKKGNGGPVVRVQRSRFIDQPAPAKAEDATFFEIALARPLALTEGTNTAVVLGLLADERFKRTVRFWNDPAVPTVDVNLTCERCPLPPDVCEVRAAPPTVLDERARQARREAALAELGVSLG
jgi:transcriptional regulator with XRE-family HTH domain